MDNYTSYWMVSAETPDHPPLTEDITVDVAVVGAGIAGLSIASELARTGRSVALLEAGAVAAGVTGGTTAKVSVLHGAIYHHLAEKLGPDTAEAYATSQTLAMEHVAATTERLGVVDCELERQPAFVYTESADDVDMLRREADAARRAGLAATFTQDTGLPFPVAGAVRVEDQLVFHPRKYLRAVADEYVTQGGLLFEHTRVTDLHEGSPCVVTTEAGHRVTARDVVVATHYPIFDRAMMFSRLTPKREFAIAGVVEESADPRAMYVSTSKDTRSLRGAPYEGGRLLIATGSPFTPGDSKAPQQLEQLKGWLTDRFPVDGVRFVWAAQDNMSGDQVPFIGPLHPGAKHAWVATGFNAWGMTSGVLSSLLLRDLVDGRPQPWARIYDPRRVHPALEAKTVVSSGARSVAGLAGNAGARLKAKLGRVPSADGLAPGQAAIVSDSEGEWATYVDEDGVRHSVSPTCTHMGCLVSFNGVEKAWECPCHGSRFGLDGAVLQGPATRPLRRHKNDE